MALRMVRKDTCYLEVGIEGEPRNDSVGQLGPQIDDPNCHLM